MDECEHYHGMRTRKDYVVHTGITHFVRILLHAIVIVIHSSNKMYH